MVCAYVALFAEREPQLTTTYGDLAHGYIVTPALPEGHRPSPRPPRAAPAPAVERTASGAVQEYALLQPSLREAADRCVAQITTMLDDAGINYLSVTGRAKSVASFATKAAREIDGTPVFADPLRDITDQIGVRVITYLHRDVDAVAQLLADQAVVLDDRDMGRETASEGRFGYSSRHLLARRWRRPWPPASRCRCRSAPSSSTRGRSSSTTSATRAPSPRSTCPTSTAASRWPPGLLELADREFSQIRDRLQAGMTGPRPEPDRVDPRLSAQELAAFLAGQYADASWSRTDHYAWISGLLLELGITSLTELADLLRPVDSEALNARLGYQHPPSAVRRLDDALLHVFADRYIELHGNAHREDLLRARLGKMAD